MTGQRLGKLFENTAMGIPLALDLRTGLVCEGRLTTYEPLFRLYMSELQHPAQIRRLIGNTKEPGALVQHIRNCPFSVLLLDEIEKGAPSFLVVLLTVLDEGRLSDALGRTTDFRNTTIAIISKAITHGNARRIRPRRQPGALCGPRSIAMRIIICGGGVIGAAIAYALTERGFAPTVVEAVAPACAASGKSGGFLALDWCDGSAMSALARRSFQLHAELGKRFGDRTGYRRMDTLAIVATQTPSDLRDYARAPAPEWLDGQCAVHGQLGTPASTAQVHPKLFTQVLLDEAARRGAELVIGRVDGIHHDGGKVNSITVDRQRMNADAVVVAMGPWSALATAWLPVPSVMGEKGASIVLEPSRPIGAHALFGEFVDAQGEHHSPEVFPRPDGQVYLCGAPERASLPENPSSIEPGQPAIDKLVTIANALSSGLKAATLVQAQACYRPIVHDALPVMGRVDGIDGAYIATAHNCWGILNAPTSGEAMAELITNGHTEHVDLGPFAPGRLLQRRAAAWR